eukprot:260288_1
MTMTFRKLQKRLCTPTRNQTFTQPHNSIRKMLGQNKLTNTHQCQGRIDILGRKGSISTTTTQYRYIDTDMNCKDKDGNDGSTEEVNGFIQCFVPTGDLNDVDFFRAEFAHSLVEFIFPTLIKRK